MIKKIQQDFSYYSHEFKDNYRKGVHRLRTILASRAQAQAFVSNAGGTAVVLGYEPDTPDKNAQELYALLAASPYIDNAVQTFLGSIYEAGAESQDAMYSDSARCLEILHDPVMSRAAGAGTVSAGKWIATLAGQSCNLYRDMNAVAASDIAMTAVAASETAMEAVISGTIALNAVAASKTAMTAVAANETAMAAVAASRVAMSAIIGNSTALNAVVTSSVAMAAVIGNSTALNAVVSSSTAMAAIIANSTALNAVVSSSAAMSAVAASQTAMAAIIGNSTALNAVVSSSTAMAAIEKSQVAKDAIAASDMATAKYAVGAAGLKPADYANMAAVAASQTAMAAIASSQTAMAAIASSQTAMAAVAASYVAVAAVYGSAVAVDAVKANETAWATLTGATSAVMGKAVAVLSGLNPDSYADMTAVASSSTAMAAIASSSTARTAITNSATAKNALASSPLKTTVTKGNGNGWENRTIRNGMGYLISCYNANSGGEAGSTWYKLDGAQTSQPAGTTNVGKFFTSSLAIYWWSSTSSVTYIPC